MITANSQKTPAPPLSTALRNVLGVVEELEANGITVTSVEMPFEDEPAIGIEAGPELEGDEAHRYRTGLTDGPLVEFRIMTYRGVAIEWSFRVDEAAHG
jgi:hypothetical protein